MVSIAAIRGRLSAWRTRSLDAGRELAEWSPDAPDDYCARCGASTGPGGVTARGCAFCVDKRPRWHRITRLGYYGPPLDEAIKTMKFAGDWARAGWFGRRLAQALDEVGGERLLVCPVPMHRFRQWRRGFNQAELIAQALAAARRWELLPLLKRVRHTRPQSTLPASARPRNVVRAFRALPVDLTGHDLLLIDDVKTTGSTLAQCARLLKRRGARTIHCAVVAVADPKGAGFANL